MTCQWSYLGDHGDQWVLVAEDGTVLAAVNERTGSTRLATGPLLEEEQAFHDLVAAKRAVENLAIAAGFEVRYQR